MASTIKDIREETGLSLATISKYMNGGHVLAENKAKIDEAVRKLNYHPNALARGLVKNRTMTIGFVCHNVSSLFECTLIHYAGEALRRSGYGLMICDSAGDAELERHNIRFLLEKQVDGILTVAIARDSDFLQPALDAGVPVVLLDRMVYGSQLDCVTIDNREAAETAVRYLLARGHRRIACICSNEEYTGEKRLEGFCSVLETAGIPRREEYIRTSPKFSVDLGYRSMRELMALPEPPTAVFLGNYEVDLGAVIALNAAHIQYPEEVSLIGMDDLMLSGVTRPELTLMLQPMKEMVELAVDTLLRMARGQALCAAEDGVVRDAQGGEIGAGPE